MTKSSLILFGTFSFLLLIFSCITLNAPRFYTEIQIPDEHIVSHLERKPNVILRTRIGEAL